MTEKICKYCSYWYLYPGEDKWWRACGLNKEWVKDYDKGARPVEVEPEHTCDKWEKWSVTVTMIPYNG